VRGILRAACVFLLLSTPLLAADLVNTSGNVGVSGYDPVAFFTDAKPVKGNPAISATHQGATYHFATEEHRKLFQRSPERYLPQYGGYCAYGASRGALAPVQISTWQVRDGKLYLNKDPNVRERFDADFAGNVVKADANWPGLVAEHGK
jgi:YHS domain-containing protein